MKILYLTDQVYLHGGIEKVLSQKAGCFPDVVERVVQSVNEKPIST